ncbi:hypothetical protein D9M69_698090 [compost metagenome]
MQMNAVEDLLEELLCAVVEKSLAVQNALAKIIPKPAVASKRIVTADIGSIGLIERIAPVRRPVIIIIDQLLFQRGYDLS